MYCRNCGETVVKGSKFCKNCGVPIDIDINDNGSDEHKEFKNLESNQTAKTTPLLALLLYLIVITFAVAVLYYIVRDATSTGSSDAVLSATSSSQSISTSSNPQNSPTQDKVNSTKNSNQGQNSPETSAQSTPDLASIIKEWEPRIAHVVCTNDYENYSLGSGTFSYLTNGEDNALYPVLLTNAHVVVLNGYRYSSCGFSLTGNSQVYLLNTTNFAYSTTQDVEYILTALSSSLNPGVVLPDVGKMKICKTPADLGDSVVILGYPAAGGTGGAITATDGIISSYDGQYYVTSAKIDHGNSGGAAILIKDDCYLGIPTWAENGGFESYGRILSNKSFLNNN